MYLKIYRNVELKKINFFYLTKVDRSLLKTSKIVLRLVSSGKHVVVMRFDFFEHVEWTYLNCSFRRGPCRRVVKSFCGYEHVRIEWLQTRMGCEKLKTDNFRNDKHNGGVWEFYEVRGRNLTRRSFPSLTRVHVSGGWVGEDEGSRNEMRSADWSCRRRRPGFATTVVPPGWPGEGERKNVFCARFPRDPCPCGARVRGRRRRRSVIKNTTKKKIKKKRSIIGSRVYRTGPRNYHRGVVTSTATGAPPPRSPPSPPLRYSTVAAAKHCRDAPLLRRRRELFAGRATAITYRSRRLLPLSPPSRAASTRKPTAIQGPSRRTDRRGHVAAAAAADHNDRTTVVRAR